MNEQKSKMVEDGQVVTLNYTLTVEGEVVDTSDGNQPIEFIQGQRHIIPGLESKLYGMTIGDSKEVVIRPESGYGEVDPDDYADMPRSHFPAQIPLEPGVELELKDRDGDTFNARIVSVEAETVRLDFNHPLAGKELHFSVEVVALRDATDEEIEHGHVHEGHNHSS